MKREFFQNLLIPKSVNAAGITYHHRKFNAQDYCGDSVIGRRRCFHLIKFVSLYRVISYLGKRVFFLC